MLSNWIILIITKQLHFVKAFATLYIYHEFQKCFIIIQRNFFYEYQMNYLNLLIHIMYIKLVLGSLHYFYCISHLPSKKVLISILFQLNFDFNFAFEKRNFTTLDQFKGILIILICNCQKNQISWQKLKDFKLNNHYIITRPFYLVKSFTTHYIESLISKILFHRS